MDKTQPEKRGSLETTSSSSRSKRVVKPKTFSDDFYYFGNAKTPSKSFLKESAREHSHFSTSTPVKESVKPGKGRTKRAEIEPTLDESNIININDCEQLRQTEPQNETSQLERNIFDFIENPQQNGMNETRETIASDTNVHNDSASIKILPCTSTDFERLSSVEEIEDISNVFETKKNGELDYSLQERPQLCASECRSKVSSALEEPADSDFKGNVSNNKKLHTPQRSRNKKKNDTVSLAVISSQFCEKDDPEINNKRKNLVIKNDLKKSTKKRKKIDTSREDSNVKENVETIEAPEICHHNSSGNMTQDVGSESLSNAENIHSESVSAVVSFESSMMEKKNSTVDLDVAAMPQKKSRGRPRKHPVVPLSQEMQKTSLSESMQGESVNELAPFENSLIEKMNSATDLDVDSMPQKRSRGRKRKNPAVPLPQETSVNFTQEMPISLSQETQITSASDTSIPPVSVKRPRGRPPMSVTTPRERPPMSVTRPRGRPPKNVIAKPPAVKKIHASNASENLPEGAKSPTCELCQRQMEKLSILKLHMMTDHSLMWTEDSPEGYDNPYNVVKKLGHIDCQKCSKRFRFPQYYKHHQIWCGREEELENCTICNHTVKAMWLQQHMAVHKKLEKKIALGNQQQENPEGDATQQVEDGDSEGSKASKRLKRTAAKKAIKLMSSLNDTTEPNDASSSDGYSKESSDESSDNEEDDFDGEHDRSRRKVKKGVKFKPKEEVEKLWDSRKVDSTSSNIWVNICNSGTTIMTPKERLRVLCEFYGAWLKGRAFPEMTPRRQDWEPLVGSEKENYMPAQKESHQFTVGSTDGTKDPKAKEYSLKIGHTMSLHGINYFYVGGPVWAVEWCPLPDGVKHESVLAVSVDMTTAEPPDTATMVGGPGNIQIWSTGLLENKIDCTAKPVLQYAIAHDSGYVRSLSWCPKSCFDMNAPEDGYLKRLGLLAVACSDGKVLIFSPPRPEELRNDAQPDKTGSVFRPPPALVLVPNSSKGCGPCMCVSWQQGADFKYVAAGYGHGSIFVWDLANSSPLLKVDSSTLRPARHFSCHRLAVLALTWNPRIPSVFVSASFDFSMCLWSVESQDQPIGAIRRHNSHQFPLSVCWAGPLHNGFFSTSDKTTGTDGNRVCYHGLSKAALTSNYMSITVQYHFACTWDVNFNPFYDVMVTCDALGKVKVTQLPMRDVRCRGPGKFSWNRSKIICMDLYQVKLRSSAVAPSRQTENMLAEKCSDTLCDSQTTSKTNHKQNQPATQKQLLQRDEDHEHVQNMNKTVTTQQTSDGPDSNNKRSHLKNKNKCIKKANQLITQDNVIVESHGEKSDEISQAKDNDDSLKGISAAHRSNTISQKKSASNSTLCKDDNLVKFSASYLESEVNSGTILTEDSTSCSRDHSSEPASKDSTACSESSPSEISKTLLSPPGDAHFTSIQGTRSGTQTTTVVGPTTNTQDIMSDILSTPVANKESLHFQNCKVTKPDLKPVAGQEMQAEVFGGSNSHAVHRVRLNPNAGCCLWLASGGQSGILRLDNLSNFVQTHPINR